jgi:phage shock protein B
MHSVGGILAVLFIFGLPVIAVCGFIFLRALRIIKGDPNQRNRETQVEEMRLMQDLHDGLQRMERRIEALETIILDRPRKERHE